MAEQDNVHQPEDRENKYGLLSQRSQEFLDFADKYYGDYIDYQPGYEPGRIIKSIDASHLFVISDCTDGHNRLNAKYSISRTYFLYDPRVHSFKKSHAFNTNIGMSTLDGLDNESEFLRYGESRSQCDILRIRDSDKSTLEIHDERNTIAIHREEGLLEAIQLTFDSAGTVLTDLDLNGMKRGRVRDIEDLERVKYCRHPQERGWYNSVRKFDINVENDALILKIDYGDVQQSLQVMYRVDTKDVLDHLIDPDLLHDPYLETTALDIPWKNADIRKLYGVDWSVRDFRKEERIKEELDRIRKELYDTDQPIV